MSETVKLYNVPRNTWVRLPDGAVVLFHHIDGMYSFCTVGKEIVHIKCNTEVEVLERAA